MLIKINAQSVLLLSILCSSALVGCTRHEPGLTIGDRFPEVKLHTLDGAPASTAEHRGSAVLINVWATWCAPCRKEMPALQRLAQVLAAENADVRVIGIAVDTDNFIVRELLVDMGVTFKNYLGPGLGAVNNPIALASYPQTFLVGADGRLKGRIEGARDWDQRDMRDWLDQRLGVDLASATTE